MAVQITRQQVTNGIIDNDKVDASAGIAESKLALAHATHSNANDPTTDEKAALAGEGTPSGTNKYVTKSYADGLAAGIRDPKDACRLASTANIGTLSGLLTIDGKVCVAGDRVLVKNQTAGEANGIYAAAAGAWSRSSDADVSAEVTMGLSVLITDGDTLSGTGWVLTTADPIVLGTTPLTFVQTKAPDSILAGNGMTRTDNTLNVVTADTSLTVSADSMQVNLTTNGGLEVSTGVKVKAGDGIVVGVGGTAVSLASNPGLEFSSGALKVKPTSGLALSAAGVGVQGGEDETIAGARGSMTLSQTPVGTWALKVFYNGQLCRRVAAGAGVGEYTWSGTTVTLGFTAADGEWLYASYLY